MYSRGCVLCIHLYTSRIADGAEQEEQHIIFNSHTQPIIITSKLLFRRIIAILCVRLNGKKKGSRVISPSLSF